MDDATRLTLATRRIVSRFMPAKRPSSFFRGGFRDVPGGTSALRASQHSPPPVQRSHRRSGATCREPPSCTLDVMKDFGSKVEFASGDYGWGHSSRRCPVAQIAPCPFQTGLRNRWNDPPPTIARSRLAGPGPRMWPITLPSWKGRVGKEGVPQSLIGYPSEEPYAGSHLQLSGTNRWRRLVIS
jgi:hypothetical protein